MKTHWLRHLREQIDLTQEELAARMQLEGADVSRSTIASWEVGRYPPPLNNPVIRHALANALRVNVRMLLSLAGYEVDTDHSVWAERAASIIDRLPEEKQRLALRIVEQLMD